VKRFVSIAADGSFVDATLTSHLSRLKDLLFNINVFYSVIENFVWKVHKSDLTYLKIQKNLHRPVLTNKSFCKDGQKRHYCPPVLLFETGTTELFLWISRRRSDDIDDITWTYY